MQYQKVKNKCLKTAETSVFLIAFNCHLWRQRLSCCRFFLSLYMNQVPEMLY